MTYAIKSAAADLLKWIGWRLIRLADRLDDPPSGHKVGGTD
jgi:hypothetical protein